MKVVLYLTHRVMFKWPQEYINDFARKANASGFDVNIISDDTDVSVAKREIETADFFVGVKSPFDWIIPKGERIYFSGAKKSGGIQSPIQCAGCIDNMEDIMDCLWEDNLCMWEITPNDILEVMCGS